MVCLQLIIMHSIGGLRAGDSARLYIVCLWIKLRDTSVCSSSTCYITKTEIKDQRNRETKKKNENREIERNRDEEKKKSKQNSNGLISISIPVKLFRYTRLGGRPFPIPSLAARSCMWASYVLIRPISDIRLPTLTICPWTVSRASGDEDSTRRGWSTI